MKACIFDLDGTLTDTLESLCYSVNETLKEMGLASISSEECRSFVGNGARTLMERALQAAGDGQAERIDECMKIYQRIFSENCTYHVTPYKGIEAVLSSLKDQKIKLCVLSNKPHDQTVKVVREIFGDSLFLHVQGQSGEIEKKPSPAGIQYLLSLMEVDTQESIYVGDSEVDIETGLAAGVKTIGVSWGFRSRIILEEAGASDIIDTPKELLAIINE